MVEFALVLPLWLLIIGMVFMVAWLGYLQISLERAVHEGAKAGAIFRDGRDTIAKAQAKEAMGAVTLEEDDLVVTVCAPGSPPDCPDPPLFPQGTISILAKYDWNAPFSFGLPSSFQLQARAVATLEP